MNQPSIIINQDFDPFRFGQRLFLYRPPKFLLGNLGIWNTLFNHDFIEMNTGIIHTPHGNILPVYYPSSLEDKLSVILNFTDFITKYKNLSIGVFVPKVKLNIKKNIKKGHDFNGRKHK